MALLPHSHNQSHVAKHKHQDFLIRWHPAMLVFSVDWFTQFFRACLGEWRDVSGSNSHSLMLQTVKFWAPLEGTRWTGNQMNWYGSWTEPCSIDAKKTTVLSKNPSHMPKIWDDLDIWFPNLGTRLPSGIHTANPWPQHLVSNLSVDLLCGLVSNHLGPQCHEAGHW